ncbi:MAG: hypothetical protein H6712_25320 [Myxococcales bacterium]|nr:hypothetical protein [Myxococcales bacterium]MCB9717195.1 hypothetical protein [Myxococcales bacterium]
MSKRFPGAHAPWTSVAPLAAWLLACGGSSLDERTPSSPAGTDTGTDSLPPLDTGAGSSSSGGPDDEPEPTGPLLCAPGCRMIPSVDWAYEGAPDPMELEPGTHWIPALLREPDGGITVAEQRRSWATLHRLDPAGTLQWNRALPLPCDLCELGDLSRHPSGDLLLGAAGHVIDGELALLAARYDPQADVVVWSRALPLAPLDGATSRSGSIVAVSDAEVVQLVLEGIPELPSNQSAEVVVYGLGGEVLERVVLGVQTLQTRRWPLLARPSPQGDLAVALPRGTDSSPYGQLARMEAPLWIFLGALSRPEPLDDLEVDERDHLLTLSHAFDGDHTYLLLDDRAELEPEARWVATLAIESTAESRADLARGPDGDLYTAVRVTRQVELPPDPDAEDEPGPQAEPLVGLSLARWTSQGELRWSTTVLMDVAEGPRPVALEVDEDEGLLVATVAGGRLRAERWEQRCECE